MKLQALHNLTNAPLADGARMTREQWHKRAERQLSPADRALGFRVTVAEIENERGQYYRIHAAAMPQPYPKLKH